jgi:hypothetical protein
MSPDGFNFDLFVSNADERIPGARFVSLESGGHLRLGQQKKGDELARFFASRRKDRGAERMAS